MSTQGLSRISFDFCRTRSMYAMKNDPCGCVLLGEKEHIDSH